MKDTGIVRRLDELGRITIPIELRRSLGVEDRGALEIYTDQGRRVLEKYEPTDLFTGSKEDLYEYCGKIVSKESIIELAKLAGVIE